MERKSFDRETYRINEIEEGSDKVAMAHTFLQSENETVFSNPLNMPLASVWLISLYHKRN